MLLNNKMIRSSPIIHETISSTSVLQSLHQHPSTRMMSRVPTSNLH